MNAKLNRTSPFYPAHNGWPLRSPVTSGVATSTLVKFNYLGCGKAARGVLNLMKVSGYSRAQVKRLIKQYRDMAPRQRTVRGFVRRYSKADTRLLAAMDERPTG